MAEYRIDELARLAGTTVRNVRVYQDRGLLAPPRREGRVGIYSEAHLVRLRMIGHLLQRGYTFANIAELVEAWERGGDLNDVLGLESVIGDPWTDEVPSHIDVAGLQELYGDEVTPENTARAIRLGLLEEDGDRFRVPSPRLLHAGAELVSAGMSLATVLDIAERLGRQVDTLAADLVGTVSEHILTKHAPNGMISGEDVPAAAELVRRLRPLAQQAVDAMLAKSMARHLDEVMGAHFAEVMELLRAEQDRDSRSA
ncbi:MerR family transcriptional regulator [Lipingzhangella sp. LS1_29]|uniref:MerR family transcriptional regulator n=1 Tax=Lipingzhangella rawalii TaxID=2055835 RepID=A0ABU2HBA7_9ACTN|nr:MerR family transcriptional regulator [Lipingzhangella rawalii]MDS1272566.1 MerR family transcriptional regulator [Lipingzhangella rawalii]